MAAHPAAKRSKSDEMSESGSFECEEKSNLAFSFGDPWNWGIVLHFFCNGFVTGGINAVMVGVLAGYLNVVSDVIQGSLNLANLPEVFAVVMGILSDSRPCWGYRRRPYMAGGWFLVAACFGVMLVRGLPEPYYCFDTASGDYLHEQAPCNPEAPDYYAFLMLCLCFSSVGLVASTAAANGLLVEYAKDEPPELRGRTQTLLSMVGSVGTFTSTLVAAFGFNGRMFTGSFAQEKQLSFRQYIGIFVGLSLVAGVLCLFCVREGAGSRVSVRRYFRSSWRLFESRAFCAVALYYFATASIFNINTTAGMWVTLEWAHVKTLQRQLTCLLGVVLALFGSWLMQRYLLNVSWRKMILVTTLCAAVLDATPQFVTIFDILRDQYFYLGEPIASNVPNAMSNLIRVFVINELADEGNSALVAGLVTTVNAVGNPVSVLLSNELFSLFTPALATRSNYIEDTPAFRRTVAYSYVLSYFFTFASLALLPLLPRQKEEAQSRKREWDHRPSYALVAAAVLACGFSYTLVGDVLIMDPALACLRFLGGQGC